MKTVAAAMALAVMAGAGEAQVPADHPVIELRQYKIVAGKRDAMIALFEREFVESQEALGAQLVGQFCDADDPSRFTWIRAFPDMPERGRMLNAFYFGPVWQAHRGEANPMLYDNDDVLLLRPAWNGSGFAAVPAARAAPGAAAPAAGAVTASIYYLWKAPMEGFGAVFHDRVAPRLRAAGLPVLAAYVPEEQANNFPRLPVRQGEKVFVWFCRTADRATFDQAIERLERNQDWRENVAATLADAQDRPAQILRLQPTPRSALR